MTEGIKYDEGKVRLDLLPWDALDGVGQVLTYGANKYGDRNWENGLHWGRLVGATLRHLFSWLRREDYDKESGMHHLAHASCCLLMLYTLVLRGDSKYDDRTEL